MSQERSCWSTAACQYHCNRLEPQCTSPCQNSRVLSQQDWWKSFACRNTSWTSLRRSALDDIEIRQYASKSASAANGVARAQSTSRRTQDVPVPVPLQSTMLLRRVTTQSLTRSPKLVVNSCGFERQSNCTHIHQGLSFPSCFLIPP